MEDRLPRLLVVPHESGDSGSDLVEFEALVVDPGREEVMALGSHLPKDDFVDEELVFAAIVTAAASFLHFGEQVIAFKKDLGPFCNDGGQKLADSW